jgi:hypothetical protein
LVGDGVFADDYASCIRNLKWNPTKNLWAPCPQFEGDPEPFDYNKILKVDTYEQAAAFLGKSSKQRKSRYEDGQETLPLEEEDTVREDVSLLDDDEVEEFKHTAKVKSGDQQLEQKWDKDNPPEYEYFMRDGRKFRRKIKK